jgi:hypothetical protein
VIKIQFSGSQPNMYQVDRSYSLPSVTGQVRWNGSSKCFEVCDNNNGNYSASGGWMKIDNTVDMTVSGPDVWEMHRWIEEKKREEAELKELRNKYPTLDEAYNHYNLIKELVKAGSEYSNETEPNRP